MQSPTDTRCGGESLRGGKKMCGSSGFSNRINREFQGTQGSEVFGMLSTAPKLHQQMPSEIQRDNSPNDRIYEPIFPLITRKALTSFCRLQFCLPIKHRGRNSHVEPHFRRQATFFLHREIPFPIKRLWHFFLLFHNSWEALTEATNQRSLD